MDTNTDHFTPLALRVRGNKLLLTLTSEVIISMQGNDFCLKTIFWGLIYIAFICTIPCYKIYRATKSDHVPCSLARARYLLLLLLPTIAEIEISLHAQIHWCHQQIMAPRGHVLHLTRKKKIKESGRENWIFSLWLYTVRKLELSQPHSSVK